MTETDTDEELQEVEDATQEEEEEEKTGLNSIDIIYEADEPI